MKKYKSCSGGGGAAGSCMSPLPQHIENNGQDLLLPEVVEHSMSQCKEPHPGQVLSICPRSCLSDSSRYGCLAVGTSAMHRVCGGGGPAVWVCGGGLAGVGDVS